MRMRAGSRYPEVTKIKDLASRLRFPRSLRPLEGHRRSSYMPGVGLAEKSLMKYKNIQAEISREFHGSSERKIQTSNPRILVFTMFLR